MMHRPPFDMFCTASFGAPIAFLAAASLGAIWSSCSPDFGTQAISDRFGQIEPVVLFAVDGYVYNGRSFDIRYTVEELKASGVPAASIRREQFDFQGAASPTEELHDAMETR